ncbi:dynein regulatory complex subunit 4-like [Argopecten irradians]|uniref:dynein regulatory complex subunit 4-like n=1 Tax=Argopecten irradians TaxID=31199 RepID=UPI003719E41C
MYNSYVNTIRAGDGVNVNMSVTNEGATAGIEERLMRSVKAEIQQSEERTERKFKIELIELRSRVDTLSTECEDLKEQLQQKEREAEKREQDIRILQEELNRKTAELEIQKRREEKLISAMKNMIPSFQEAMDVCDELSDVRDLIGEPIHEDNQRSAQVPKT